MRSTGVYRRLSRLPYRRRKITTLFTRRPPKLIAGVGAVDAQATGTMQRAIPQHGTGVGDATGQADIFVVKTITGDAVATATAVGDVERIFGHSYFFAHASAGGSLIVVREMGRTLTVDASAIGHLAPNPLAGAGIVTSGVVGTPNRVTPIVGAANASADLEPATARSITVLTETLFAEYTAKERPISLVVTTGIAHSFAIDQFMRDVRSLHAVAVVHATGIGTLALSAPRHPARAESHAQGNLIKVSQLELTFHVQVNVAPIDIVVVASLTDILYTLDEGEMLPDSVDVESALIDEPQQVSKFNRTFVDLRGLR